MSRVNINDHKETEREPKWKTITLEEYKKVLQLIPEIEKYKKIVQKLEKQLQSKDSQLKELQESFQCDSINVSNLSAVSVSSVSQ